MTSPDPLRRQYRTVFVLALTLVTGIVFLTVVRNFVLVVLVAAIFSALLYPLYQIVRDRMKTGPAMSSGIVLTALIIAVGIPLTAVGGLVAAEAFAVSEKVSALQSGEFGTAELLAFNFPEWVPFRDALASYKSQIVAKLSSLAGAVGSFLFNSISDVTEVTISVMISGFVLLYAMFFFLMRGPELLDSVFRHLPLDTSERNEILNRGLAVTAATLKSILIVGALQGVLVGIAFWVLGIPGAAFWGMIVLILSAIPALGSVVVWGPAAIYLFATDQIAAAAGLVVWGALIVGLVDNILRPRIVGREVNIPDLIILVAILGGIATFGIVGIVVGPLLAAVLLNVLSVYRAVFANSLPDVPDREVENDVRGKPDRA